MSARRNDRSDAGSRRCSAWGSPASPPPPCNCSARSRPCCASARRAGCANADAVAARSSTTATVDIGVPRRASRCCCGWSATSRRCAGRLARRETSAGWPDATCCYSAASIWICEWSASRWLVCYAIETVAVAAAVAAVAIVAAVGARIVVAAAAATVVATASAETDYAPYLDSASATVASVAACAIAARAAACDSGAGVAGSASVYSAACGIAATVAACGSAEAAADSASVYSAECAIAEYAAVGEIAIGASSESPDGARAACAAISNCSRWRTAPAAAYSPVALVLK